MDELGSEIHYKEIFSVKLALTEEVNKIRLGMIITYQNTNIIQRGYFKRTLYGDNEENTVSFYSAYAPQITPSRIYLWGTNKYADLKESNFYFDKIEVEEAAAFYHKVYSAFESLGKSFLPPTGLYTYF